MSTSPVVSAKNLSKSFGGFKAVDQVSFDINPGQCFGLLGPNGAGKSTIISMIYGSASRSSGELSVLGFDPKSQARSVKKNLGVVTQENALDTEMNVTENMHMFAHLSGVPEKGRNERVDNLLEFMSLTHKKDAAITALSGGMQRRLVFVRALLNDPKFVILDEPTTGLDPAVRQLIWVKVQELIGQGKTVLLTTHYMDEAELLCDRLVIMNEGKIQATGTPRELIDTHCPGYVALLPKSDAIRKTVEGEPEFTFIEDGSNIHLRGQKLAQLSQFLESKGIEPEILRPANLEDAFLTITGRELTAHA